MPETVAEGYKDNMTNFIEQYFSLQGQVSIVTGGNTGIGKAYVQALAQAGSHICISAFDDDYQEIEQFVKSQNVEFLCVKVDLTTHEGRTKLVDACLKKFGKIDILVNNAGTIKRNPLLEYTEKDWNTVMDININAVYFLSQAIAKIMEQQGGGKIINIASMLSFQGGKFVPAYTASKHAVAGITKAFANELANKNIQVNAIAPGYIATANTAPIRADEQRNAEILSRIPAGYWGQPEDLMGTIIFLASKASNYVNGHILAVDGGWLTR